MATPERQIPDSYEILDRIGGGGMGAVYKVRHRLLDEIRVVKVIHPDLATSEELQQRFKGEARTAIRLRHANIAQLLDFSIEADGSAYIVMEYIEGLTLKQVLARSGALPVGLALEIGRQALTAIGFLHRRGVVHRDISPDNLMLTRDPEGRPLVKLIDLGIAKVLAGSAAGLTLPGTFLGKPRYVSPERIAGDGVGKVDGRSDLYSFAVVLYELATGRCPIEGADAPALLMAHLSRPPLAFAVSDPGGRVPPALREVLLAGLAKKPADRIATAEDFARRLEAIQASHPLQPGDFERALSAAGTVRIPPAPAASPPPPTQRTTVSLKRPGEETRRSAMPVAPAEPPEPDLVPDPERSSRPWWLALAAVLLITVVLGLILWRRGEKEPASPPPPPVETVVAHSEPGPPAETEKKPGRAVRRDETPSPKPSPTPVETAPKKERINVPIVTGGPGFEDARPLAPLETFYPEAARGSGLHPWVAVFLMIDETGNVTEARIVGPGDKSGLGFNEAARDAALKAKFKPATRNGVPVRTQAELTYKF